MTVTMLQELIELYNAEHEEEIRQAREQHEQLMGQRGADRYNKHYSMCSQVVIDIVDLTTRIAEYREFTNKSVLRCCFSSMICAVFP